MQNKSNYDVIILGCGAAGMTCAMYLKRVNINPLIIEQTSPGGTLNSISNLSNYPGYIEKSGATLAFRMYSQIEELSVDMKLEKVENITKENDNYIVKTNKNIYISKIIVIATGKMPRKLNILNAQKYEGKGISYCATCDGTLYKEKDVAIIGGGNSAIATANYLSNIVNKIYIINRSEKLRATDKLVTEDLNKIEILFNSNIKEIIEENDKIIGIRLNDEKEINVEGIFVCIGKENNNAFYQNLNLNTDDKGIIVDDVMQTSMKNVYAIGDVVSKSLYQVINASGEGAVAASNIIKTLREISNN